MMIWLRHYKTVSFFAALILPVILFLRIPAFFSYGGKDVGAFAYIGDMILKGQIPYIDLWVHGTPLLYYLNALLFSLFGSSFRTIASFEIIWIFISCIFIYKLSKQIFTSKVCLAISFIFAVYLASPGLAQSFGMTETFLILPAIIAIFAAIRYERTSKKHFLLLSGFMASSSFLFKQPGIVVAAPILLYLTINSFSERRKSSYLFLSYTVFLLGALIPIAAFSIYLFTKGALGEALSLIFGFSFNYYRKAFSLPTYIKFIFRESFLWKRPFLITIAATGIIYKFAAVLRTARNKNFMTSLYGHRLFIMVLFWFVSDLYCISLSGYYYGHYTVQALPSLVLLGGFVLDYLFERFKVFFKPLAGLMALFLFISSPLLYDIDSTLSFIKDVVASKDSSKFIEIYGVKYKPSPRSLLAQWVINNTSKGDYVYFFGHETGINFLTKTKSPTRYLLPAAVPMSDYTKESDLKRFFGDLKEHPPKFIIGERPKLKKIEDQDNLSLFRKFMKERYIYYLSIDQWDIYRRK